MALVIDTCFLLTHTFPPTPEDREKLKHFTAKIHSETLLIPSIVITEYIKIAGRRIGKDSANIKLRHWINAGAKVIDLTEEIAFKAGDLALKHPQIPLADIIIATIAHLHNAKVITDDKHFDKLGVKTIWYKTTK